MKRKGNHKRRRLSIKKGFASLTRKIATLIVVMVAIAYFSYLFYQTIFVTNIFKI
jgi:phage-related holin